MKLGQRFVKLDTGTNNLVDPPGKLLPSGQGKRCEVGSKTDGEAHHLTPLHQHECATGHPSIQPHCVSW